MLNGWTFRDVATACLTAEIFSDVRTLRRLPDDFCFKAEPVSLKLPTHNNMVFLSGTLPCRPTPKCLRKNRCVAMTESQFLKISFSYKRMMFTIPRHDGNGNGVASASQGHTSHPHTAHSACTAAILNPGDRSAGPCINVCIALSAHYVTITSPIIIRIVLEKRYNNYYRYKHNRYGATWDYGNIVW
jgi:hypothetical protein